MDNKRPGRSGSLGPRVRFLLMLAFIAILLAIGMYSQSHTPASNFAPYCADHPKAC